MARPPTPTRGRKPFMLGRAWRIVAAPALLGAMGMSTPPGTLHAGSWGGEQVMLVVAADKAVLRLGCAEGEFAAPIRLDSDGHFSVSGTFTPHRGGPSTPGESNLKARYEGVLAGERLTLAVRHGTSTETYQLTHGMQSKVIRCL